MFSWCDMIVIHLILTFILGIFFPIHILGIQERYSGDISWGHTTFLAYATIINTILLELYFISFLFPMMLESIFKKFS